MVAGKICNEPITSGEDKGQAILACLDLTSVSPDTQVGRTSAPTGADSDILLMDIEKALASKRRATHETTASGEARQRAGVPAELREEGWRVQSNWSGL